MPDTEACPETYQRLAEEMAEAARGVTLEYFRQPLAAERKDDETPVTRADRETEALMRRMIARACPDHGVIGEEQDDHRPGASHVWVIDPIDGTKKFITGHPLFGTLIALVRDGRPILGLIDIPAAGERWLGAQGLGASFCDARGRRPLRCRPCPEIARAALYTTSPQMFVGDDLASFERLRRAVWFPLYGGECYAYGLLANGWADLVIEADMGIYDYLSHVAIVREAGGVITDWEGVALGLNSGGRVLAAGDPACHAAALGLLRA